MKKILFLILATIYCCGCTGGAEKKEVVVHDNWMSIPCGYVRYIEFDGHQYVQYLYNKGDGGGSLCHSPNCPCHQERYKK